MPSHRTAGEPLTSDPDTFRIRERFERLLAAGISISSERSLDRVLQQVVDSARAVVEARYAALGILGEDGATLVRFAASGLSEAERERIGAWPRGRGLLGAVIRDRKPLRIAEIGAHPEAYGFPAHHPAMRSFLGVPVVGRTGPVGNLYMGDKIGAREFSAEDESIAVLLAAQAAVAVENARLYDETAQLLGRVQAMQRQRDQFFAMINHELRNALTGVYGWAERLLRSHSGRAAARAAREVYEGAERAVTLMNNLLDLSRLDAGKVQAVWRQAALRDVVERARALVQPAADAKRIALEEEFPEPSPRCRTDTMRFEQILVNLLSNAIRHSPSGETVAVRVETTADEILVHVIDRGPGIPLEAQGKIFEPYIRVDPESGLGSGLGLPVSRRLAELLGGRLSVHSALGRGATFTLAVPSAPPGE
ncbi:MAG: GAF domain-containing sensor histidine kinase [Gemmatimonadetes bacterium]|nr:GAF domain-containing sensor histidine kinase [Gemmatimonadota bacterium]